MININFASKKGDFSKKEKRLKNQEKIRRALQKHKKHLVRFAISFPKTLEFKYKLKVIFLNNKIKKDYEGILGDPESQEAKKLEELIKDISRKPWGLQGDGNAEILKGKNSKKEWKDRKYAVFTRRLNHEDRLAYIYIGGGTLVIISCQGHYP